LFTFDETEVFVGTGVATTLGVFETFDLDVRLDDPSLSLKN
jgi:hypothetical protein